MIDRIARSPQVISKGFSTISKAIIAVVIASVIIVAYSSIKKGFLTTISKKLQELVKGRGKSKDVTSTSEPKSEKIMKNLAPNAKKIDKTSSIYIKEEELQVSLQDSKTSLEDVTVSSQDVLISLTSLEDTISTSQGSLELLEDTAIPL
ncbi:MAG: hypothetical protein KAH32_05255, partial [Chlamydiia bacterium]|nr:hypothetical protein [Chlamydiia bacterium]